MLRDEILLEEDVPANSLHSMSRAFVCAVSWEHQEQKHNLNWNFSTWCLSNPPAPLSMGFSTKTTVGILQKLEDSGAQYESPLGVCVCLFFNSDILTVFDSLC